MAKENAFNYGVFENTQLIQADFTQISLVNFKPDLIFLNPEVVENSDREKFSLFKDITPDLINSLLKSFKICKNLIICLPKFTKIEDIASLFSTLFKRTDRSYFLFNID